MLKIEQVTWDKYSMIIRGERMFKIKAMGFNTVSIYTYWGLTAAEAGIYLIARPGPYINAEMALGGYLGWTARIKAPFRGNDPEFVNTTELYAATVAKLIADAQITKWGSPDINITDFPAQVNSDYIERVKQQFKKTGNVSNCAPGSGIGETERAHPDIWPRIRWPENWQSTEFQGGSGTGFSSVNADACNALTYGGTNRGNLGYRGGDSSYDYGAPIKENRHIWREKYSEEKLEVKFFKLSPACLTAVAGNASNGSYVSTNQIATTLVFGTESPRNFYIICHTVWTSTNTTTYELIIPTSTGNISTPQLRGELVLTRRDSKIHATNYDIFTWAQDTSGKITLILYGRGKEVHEFAVDVINLTTTLAQTSPDDTTRNEAYDYLLAELAAEAPIANYSSPSKSIVIFKGLYLLRTAAVDGEILRLAGDMNATTDLEPIHESTGKMGNFPRGLNFEPPEITLPDFASLGGSTSTPSLPEIPDSYDDSKWVVCENPSTNSPHTLSTTASLYARDYGFHRRTERAKGGGESTLNDTISLASHSHSLESGKAYVFTLLIDHMGQDEEAPGTDESPTGLINFDLVGRDSYHNLARGPRNEVAMFAVRQGSHQPNQPSEDCRVANPTTDGVGLFTTTFALDLFVNGRQFGEFVVANLGPQVVFPVPEGVLNHDYLNTVALTLWLDGFELGLKMSLWSGYRKPWLLPRPAWREREGAY
ncbi:glycoside hydrolase family 35 protein [Hypoxylon crocopeplum]|nr:glycoside hydrolase family 35 protein [Hypoxylon crocopeplum]